MPPGSPGEAEARAARLEHAEIFPLAMFALLGMMVFATANDLLTLFVALEVLSLPLYVMCGLARRRRLLSQEAALKYFLLGAFSSAFFAYGIALAYGYAGGVRLADIAQCRRGGRSPPMPTAGRCCWLPSGSCRSACCSRSVPFPFHAWTPDVYQGAPTPVTAFMAAGTKAAAVVALMRVLFVAFGGASWDWRPLILAIVGRHDAARVAGRDRPDRRQADAWLLVRGPRGLPAGGHRRRVRRGRAGSARCRPSCSTWRSTASRRSAPSASSCWCATAVRTVAVRRTTSPAGRGSARRHRFSPARSPCSCCRSPASR